MLSRSLHTITQQRRLTAILNPHLLLSGRVSTSLSNRTVPLIVSKKSVDTPIRRRCFSSTPGPITNTGAPRKKVTLNTLRKLYRSSTPISMMTAYDYPTGRAVDQAEIDICLVGDSVGMVVLGYDSTVSVTMGDMIHHSRAARRGCQTAFLITDLPFGTYQTSVSDAIRNGFRLMQEGKAEAVKLECGKEMAGTVRAMVNAGIPVLGHVGLKPQQQSATGGYRVQGKLAHQALAILEDTLALQEAGCFGIVVECVPDEVAAAITDKLSIPTIGIGAGKECSGQVQVFHDTLGVFDKFKPRFCKRYAEIADHTYLALKSYHQQVRDREFPAEEHCFPMKEEERVRLTEALKNMDTTHVGVAV